MKTRTTINFVASYALLTAATASFSQQTQQSGHHGGASAQTPSATATTYAGQQTRAIKAMPDSEVQDLIEGKGMGLAKAAELNGYPGPMHVLELADAMQLTQEQRLATTQLLTQHKVKARMLGTELVQAERQLDTAFATQQISPEKLSALTQQIGGLQAAVRNAHLETHLQQTRLLNPQQIAHYQVLRGYSTAEAGPKK